MVALSGRPATARLPAAAGCSCTQSVACRLTSFRQLQPVAPLPATQTPTWRPHARCRHPLAPAASFEELASSSSNDARPVSAAHQVRRALGLDYGRRVVGLAVSTLGLAPRPLEGVPGCTADEQLALATTVLAVAAREACDAVVVGLPVTSTGNLRDRSTDSQQGRRCRHFAASLAAVAGPQGVRVFLADERGSTMVARQVMELSGARKGTFAKRKDSVAAAVILTTFFDDPGQAVRVKPRRPQPAADGPWQQQAMQQQPEQQQQQQAGHTAEQQQEPARQLAEQQQAQPPQAAEQLQAQTRRPAETLQTRPRRPAEHQAARSTTAAAACEG